MMWPWILGLGIIQANDTTRKLGYDFLFAFYSIYGRNLSRSDTIHFSHCILAAFSRHFIKEIMMMMMMMMSVKWEQMPHNIIVERIKYNAYMMKTWFTECSSKHKNFAKRDKSCSTSKRCVLFTCCVRALVMCSDVWLRRQATRLSSTLTSWIKGITLNAPSEMFLLYGIDESTNRAGEREAGRDQKRHGCT